MNRTFNKLACHLRNHSWEFTILIPLLLVFTSNGSLNAQSVSTEGDPMISAGAEGAETPSNKVSSLGSQTNSIPPATPASLSGLPPKVDLTVTGFGFDDNQTENINPATGNGVRFIPPDPMGAAGKSRIIAVVNTMIEARNKGGKLQWRDGLKDFFAPLSPTTFTFDPKIIYDQYEDRFVVVSLEQVTGTASVSPTNISRILIAVSKDGNPKTPTAADWHYTVINSKTVIPRPVTLFDHWADYPGFEADEEAIYITANMFTFVPFGSFGGVRLWIVAKGAGTGGFYDGGLATVTVHNPYTVSGSIATTTMPAQVHGAGGAGPGIGTYLVSYSGLSDGVNEAIQVVRVNNPLTVPTFTQEFVLIGNIETGFPALPGAPQLGSAFTINTNDRRALDAVWRNNALWLTTTIRPNSGADVNQATAYWVQLNTSAVTGSGSPSGLITLSDQGNIGGEDIAPGTFTFFPAVTVNRDNHAMFGFSASAPTIYAGAFVTGRESTDPSGTVRGSKTVQAGLAPYKRFFGGNRNRWGDYSGISIDPTNDDFAWVFNEFADLQGNSTNGFFGFEDGRWGTSWGRTRFTGNAGKIFASDLDGKPAAFGLAQNFPNPFNPSTVISYGLPDAAHASLKVFNPLGQEVATLVDGYRSAGTHSEVFDARNLASGMYFYRLQVGNLSEMKKLVLLK